MRGKDQYNTATMKQVLQDQQQRPADEVSPATDTERTNGANDEMGIDSFHVAQCALKRFNGFSAQSTKTTCSLLCKFSMSHIGESNYLKFIILSKITMIK